MHQDQNQKTTTLLSKEHESDSWNLDNYDYHLPEDRIAQTPSGSRGGSRLYVLDRKGRDQVTDFSRLAEHLPPGALLVANNSKVVPARLYGTGPGGKKAEFLLLTPLPLLEGSMQAGASKAQAEGLLKGAKRFKPGDCIRFAEDLAFYLESKGEFGKVTGALCWKGTLQKRMQACGEPPLPPYIKRQTQAQDLERYQTVYANEEQSGSVAAPTAGLHFDAEHIRRLENAGFGWTEVTLYVGYGTFSPIRCQDIREHAMHAEYVQVSQSAAAAIAGAKEQGRPVVAIGTTVVRTLEGAFMQTQGIAPYSGWVDLFIRPGFTFHVVDHLLTNFHLPRSSLLVLVSAFAGRRRVLQAYEQALASGFRFFSYGDAMFFL